VTWPGAPGATDPTGDPIIVGLGGNVGTEAEITKRFDRAREAIAALGSRGAVRSAHLYRSAPIGPDQPAFLNTAVRFIAAPGTLPAELIAAVLEIEQLLGRRRAGEPRWGPRPIDLDVLIWGARIVRTAELEVPHPRLAERRFALLPLIDLTGDDFAIPGAGRAGTLARAVTDQRCEDIAERW
jgi:2-amino-4-hydroxy-6-hydroxymethyldihydropteridine diphosphokinase